MTDEQISALLRIKRYEQPPAHYFDRLLQDVHRRQRADLLQLPLWKIAVERVQTFFGEHSMSHLSYAGALASVLIVGVTTIGLMTPGDSVERINDNKLAASGSGTGPAASPATASSFSGTLVSLEPKKVPSLGQPSIQSAQPRNLSPAFQPRYVIDARPASYEQSSSIDF